MSVIVKDMEMPKRCLDCPFLITRDNDDCILQSDEANAKFEGWDDMKESCPLIELPPHGRLIDADKLKSRLVLDNDSNELQRISADILKWIDIQETVIEGSET